MVEASKRGCDVKLIYDYVGSKKISEEHLKALRYFAEETNSSRESGAQVYCFNPLQWSFWKVRGLGFHRNHKKILLVDDHIGFCGGMNIGDQYAGTEVGGNGKFEFQIYM